MCVGERKVFLQWPNLIKARIDLAGRFIKMDGTEVGGICVEMDGVSGSPA